MKFEARSEARGVEVTLVVFLIGVTSACWPSDAKVKGSATSSTDATSIPPKLFDAGISLPLGSGGFGTGGVGGGMGEGVSSGSGSGSEGTGGVNTGGNSQSTGGSGGTLSGGKDAGAKEAGSDRSGTGGTMRGGMGGNTAGTGDAGAAGTGGSSPGWGGASTGGTEGSVVLYAVGDIGDSATKTDTATGLLLDESTEFIAVLGDIAYKKGSASDFANNFDPPWGRHKARIKPVPGNHEYETANASGYFDYFGPAAGSPSTGYYSFNLGAWHIVALNSGRCNTSPSTCISAAQVEWLRDDLAANPRACTLAFWHHPRFSTGLHGADGAVKSVAVLWDVLMEHGADVILSGHDHNYERWVPQNTAGKAVPNGITQFVVGTGGTGLRSFSFKQHPNSVVRNSTDHGILKLTLQNTRYSWQFIPVAGKSFSDTGSANCH